MAAKKKRMEGFWGFLYKNKEMLDDEEGSIEFSCAGLFRIMCCVHPKAEEQSQISIELNKIAKKFSLLEE